jgi:hypothetical protein
MENLDGKLESFRGKASGDSTLKGFFIELSNHLNSEEAQGKL